MGCSGNQLHLYDSDTGTLLRTLWSHTGLVRTIAMDQVNGLLVSGSYDFSVCVWSMSGGDDGYGLIRYISSGEQKAVMGVAVEGGRIVR
jgi:WD40 repeat protein